MANKDGFNRYRRPFFFYLRLVNRTYCEVLEPFPNENDFKESFINPCEASKKDVML